MATPSMLWQWLRWQGRKIPFKIVVPFYYHPLPPRSAWTPVFPLLPFPSPASSSNASGRWILIPFHCCSVCLEDRRLTLYASHHAPRSEPSLSFGSSIFIGSLIRYSSTTLLRVDRNSLSIRPLFVSRHFTASRLAGSFSVQEVPAVFGVVDSPACLYRDSGAPSLFPCPTTSTDTHLWTTYNIRYRRRQLTCYSHHLVPRLASPQKTNPVLLLLIRSTHHRRFPV